MSWTNWFCPREQLESSNMKWQRQVIEEWQQLTKEGFVPYCGQYWKIDMETFNKQQWQRRLQIGKKTNVRYFDFRYSQQPAILHKVIHIEFIQLRSMYLSNNQISSLEAIIHLNAPFLAHIDLRQNHITQIKSLRKAGCCFSHIFLAGNPILDYSAISEIRFHKRIKHSYVTNFYGQTNARIADISPLFKAEPMHITDRLQITHIQTLDSNEKKGSLFSK